MSDLNRDELNELLELTLKQKSSLSNLNPANSVLRTKEALVTDIINKCNELVPLNEQLFNELASKSDTYELPDDNCLTSIYVYSDYGHTITLIAGELSGNVTRLFNDTDLFDGSDIQQLVSVNQQEEIISIIVLKKD